jgi:hypothetical protein
VYAALLPQEAVIEEMTLMPSAGTLWPTAVFK